MFTFRAFCLFSKSFWEFLPRRPQSEWWMKAKMKILVDDENFKASDQCLNAFCKRLYYLTHEQKKNEQKKTKKCDDQVNQGTQLPLVLHVPSPLRRLFETGRLQFVKEKTRQVPKVSDQLGRYQTNRCLSTPPK